jgi:hypothetical protein
MAWNVLRKRGRRSTMASGPRRRHERPHRDPRERRARLHELVAALIERVEAEGFGEEPGLDSEIRYAITTTEP